MDTNQTSKSNKENVGNCLIAIQDCQPGEVVLIDSPQVIGPNHVPLPGKKYIFTPKGTQVINKKVKYIIGLGLQIFNIFCQLCCILVFAIKLFLKIFGKHCNSVSLFSYFAWS